MSDGYDIAVDFGSGCGCGCDSNGYDIIVEMDALQTFTSIDYTKMRNLPTINGTKIVGDLSLQDIGSAPVYYATKEDWDAQTSLVSESGSIYIYSNYKTYTDDDGNTVNVPGIRIGDGTTYLSDLPFLAGEGGGSGGGGTNNYQDLANKPQINSVVLTGNKPLTAFGLRSIYYDTTANWNAQTGLIPEEGAIYIYSDHYVNGSVVSPGVKIGDGNAYLSDLPFIIETDISTIVNNAVNTAVTNLRENGELVTQADRTAWNNLVEASISENDPGLLVFASRTV